MPEFPKWVTTPHNMSDEVRRKKILIFLVRRAALQLDGRASYTALARRLGLCHSTFCIYIDRGRFSEGVARSIENLVGRDLAPHELLMNPLASLEQ